MNLGINKYESVIFFKIMMMKKSFLLLLFPLQLIAQKSIRYEINDQQFENNTKLNAFIDSLISPLNKIDAPGGVLLLAKDGKPIYRKAYGMASLELGVPARPDHSFAIGSVSKQFCAVAILQLAQQGKLNLQDDIKKYLPEFNTNGKLITVEHLLTHTSGIPSSENRDWADFRYAKGDFANQDLLEYAGKKKLLFEPGTDWSYNNVAYKMASIIVERLSMLSFSDYLAKNIFKPAGMNHTFHADENIPFPNLALSYRKNFTGKWMSLPGEKWSWAKGSGAIISTPDDLLLWDVALREGKVLPKEWLEKAWKPYILKDGRSTNYNYGWSVNQVGNNRIITHGGAIYGYRTASYHIPEKNIYLLFTNYSGDASEEIPVKIIRKIMNEPAPTVHKKSELPVTDYEGVYEIHQAGTRLAKQISDIPMYHYVTVSNDSLFVQNTGGQRAYLKPNSKDCFLAPAGETHLMCFNRNATGKVVSVNTSGMIRNYGPLTPHMKVNQPLYRTPDPYRTDTAVLKKYAGLYYNAVLDGMVKIEYRDNKLFRLNAGIMSELLPVSSNRFVVKNQSNSYSEFNTNKNNELILKMEGQRTFEYKKVSDF